jgi:hypothetical protein
MASPRNFQTETLPSFDKLDPDLQSAIKDKATTLQLTSFQKLLKNDPKLNIGKADLQTYTDLRTLFQKRWLWTVGVSDTTYNNQFVFSNVVLNTEILKGISDPNHAVGVELDLKGSYQYLDDSTKTGRDLHRQILHAEPGLNIVFQTRQTHYSLAEFKLSGEFNHIASGRYASERMDSLTLNATLRVRIMNDFWIPLEIKYDPKSGNIFGFLNVRLNFGSGSASKKTSVPNT